MQHYFNAYVTKITSISTTLIINYLFIKEHIFISTYGMYLVGWRQPAQKADRWLKLQHQLTPLGVFTAWCTLVVFVNFTYFRRTNQHYTNSYCLSICRVFEKWNSEPRKQYLFMNKRNFNFLYFPS